jgi:outer membrane lipoprotein-sorting protein
LRARRRLSYTGTLLVVALAAGGCAVSKKHTVPASEIRPAKEASEEDLLAAYERLADAVRSINASVELIPTAGSAYSGVIEQYHQVQGFILAQKPESIRVIGQAPLISKNIFDMVSDGKTFRIYIPSKNQFIVGPTNLERTAQKPIENLRPQHLLDALFWPAISNRSTVLFEESDEPPARYYVLTLLRGVEKPAIDRKLWFDRVDLSLARIEVYGDAGRVISDVHLSDWQPGSTGNAATAGNPGPAGPMYPRHIVLNRPHDNYQLEIRITKLTLNEPISADRFQLAQPAGTELIQLGEGG